MQSPFRDNRYLNGFFFVMNAPQGLEANALLKITDNNNDNISKMFMACQIYSMNTSRELQSLGKLNLILFNLFLKFKLEAQSQILQIGWCWVFIRHKIF